MKMEDRKVTFPQVQTILNGINVPNVQLDDIQAILNMRDAWKFLLNTVSEEVTFEYWCKLNEYIARNEALEWGKLRTGTVGISGTDYEPPVPEKKKVVNELNDILDDTNTSATDKALKLLYGEQEDSFFGMGINVQACYCPIRYYFSAGAGIMTITDKYMEQFNFLLLNYYNTGAAEKLKQFLYENAIQGMKI